MKVSSFDKDSDSCSTDINEALNVFVDSCPFFGRFPFHANSHGNRGGDKKVSPLAGHSIIE